jgi:endonuclease/exonuclease/phosphatase family metal-dependent hydrolase
MYNRNLIAAICFSYLGIGVILSLSCNKNDVEIDYKNRTSYYKNISTINYTDSVIKCVTFNMQLGFPETADPWDKTATGSTVQHTKNIKAYLDLIKPDIICLQEVPRNRYNNVVKNFIETLAAEMNMNYAFGAHGYNDPDEIIPVKGEWGNAILSKYPITAIDNFENEYKSIWQRRSILTADVTINNKTYRIHSLHFLPSPQAETNAVNYFVSKANYPQLILGDFNLIDLPLLESNNYTDVFKADTTLGDLYYAIDRILYSNNKFTTIGMGILYDSISLPPNSISDHLANYAVLKIK